jgi:hypothetical protein
MAEKSPRTRKRGDGHTKHEMNRNREMSFGGALTTRRHGADDAPGKSSSRARSKKSGAERNQSVMAARGGSGSSGGASARVSGVRSGAVTRPGAGIKPPRKGDLGASAARKRAKPKAKRSR